MQLPSFSRTLSRTIGAGALLIATATAAFAIEFKPYDEETFKAAQAAGRQSVVHVTAPWCPTCKAQEQVIEGLVNTPEYMNVTLFKVDFDSQKAALKSFKVNSQSTLIAFNGATEAKRVIGDTSVAAVTSVFTAAAMKK
jgi:thioredoxin 1